MSITFTAHNIRLDNGEFTKPDARFLMDVDPWFVSAKRVLKWTFPETPERFRIADLGCLEGGYAVEFARLGFQVVGIDIRANNIAACQYVKAKTNLPNLQFIQDDVWNLPKYGVFDAIFCCGLLYHLDRPRQFLDVLSAATSKLLIVQTHFSMQFLNTKFALSDLTTHDGVQGRWYMEFPTETAYQNREQSRWSAWDNRRSFWIRREYLLQAIQDSGFDLVLEQFDGLGKDVVGSMLSGYYKSDDRGTFIGIKT
jgi:SAM-dependent methyltransferase